MNDTVQAAWAVLKGLPQPTLAHLFADPARLDTFSAKLDLPGGAVRFDWAKTHLDGALVGAFEDLAAAVDFSGKRAAMFAGEAINVTEGRAVEHTAQRGVGSADSVELAGMLHARMAGLVGAIHAGAL
ncbi:MAG: hypothetical protein RLZZ84_1695, partial [Pseudomonadota bacterium]